CDKDGILNDNNAVLLHHKQLVSLTSSHNKVGTLADALVGADVFVGVSVAGCVTQDMVKSMAKDCVIFAMANPQPEILPQLAKQAGAKVVGTGRSDYPNQINNVLAFPGIFRGAFDAHATKITQEMKLSAAQAIASLVGDDELDENYVIPSPFDKRVAKAVAQAVKTMAEKQGAVR
ncbi:MAG: NAD-dependent malic enzyme, partial [Clostridia bacterium]|nr:NAD-dependent malic enzyme [Clostridia bacterium]